MTSISFRPLLGASLLFFAGIQGATQITTSEPIKIETPKPKKIKFKGEVLAATRLTITVRSRKNTNLVRTFTYESELAAQIGKQFDANKIYLHGDRVEIEYLAGTDKAVKIKGKPGQKH